MAAIFETIPFKKGDPQTEFCGSSEQDSQFAKTFWQSIELLPPPESRLISADIAQRLRRASDAPPANSIVDKFNSGKKQLDTDQFYRRLVYEKNMIDVAVRRQELHDHHKEMRTLFVKHQAIRMEKEKVAEKVKKVKVIPEVTTQPEMMAGDF